MNPMKQLTAALYLSASVAFLCACEKELEMDYHGTATHYAAEVVLTPDGISATISTTRDMTEADSVSQYVNNAVVTICEEGTEWVDTLVSKGNGRYRLDYFAMEGLSYTVDICIDGCHYRATSTMHSMPVVNSFYFVWQKMFSDRVLFADLRLQDNPDENNYYFMHVYRNGVGYRWAVLDDTSNPGGELQQLFSSTTERKMDKDSDSDVLHEGDRIRLEVRSIDRPVYDFFYSMQLMGNSGTNPVSNFSGGLLGYFSACQIERVEILFHREDIR